MNVEIPLMLKMTIAWAVITAFSLIQEIVTPGKAMSNGGIDPVTVTLIGGMIVTIIGTIVTGAVTIITALRVGTVRTQSAESAQRIDSVAKDTEAIKGHVNSEKTAADGRETTLRQENSLLREMLADKKATAALLAQAASHAPARSAPASVDPAAASLERIDTNTAAIEKNTAKTEASVQELKRET